MKETEICKGKKNTKARFLLERSGPEKFVTMGPTTYGPQHGLRTPSGPPRLSVLALQGVGEFFFSFLYLKKQNFKNIC